MKFTFIALSLGCSALIGILAVPSNFNHLKLPVAPEFPGIGKILTSLRFSFSRFTGSLEAPPGPDPNPIAAMPPLPPLSKAETLLLIAAAADKHHVPAAFVKSIVAAESNFNSAALSPKGAIGLMQLMPETAEDFGADPNIPAQNVDAGTRYLRWLMNRYQKRRSPMKHVIAAYNAGPGMVDRYRGIPPFRETRTYVTRVLGFLKQFEGSRKRFATGG